MVAGDMTPTQDEGFTAPMSRTEPMNQEEGIMLGQPASPSADVFGAGAGAVSPGQYFPDLPTGQDLLGTGYADLDSIDAPQQFETAPASPPQDVYTETQSPVGFDYAPMSPQAAPLVDAPYSPDYGGPDALATNSPPVDGPQSPSEFLQSEVVQEVQAEYTPQSPLDNLLPDQGFQGFAGEAGSANPVEGLEQYFPETEAQQILEEAGVYSIMNDAPRSPDGFVEMDTAVEVQFETEYPGNAVEEVIAEETTVAQEEGSRSPVRFQLGPDSPAGSVSQDVGSPGSRSRSGSPRSGPASPGSGSRSPSRSRSGSRSVSRSRSQSPRSRSGSPRSRKSGSMSRSASRSRSGSPASRGSRSRSGSPVSRGSRSRSGTPGSRGSRSRSGSVASRGSRSRSGSRASRGSRSRSGSRASRGSRSRSGSPMSRGSRARSGSPASRGSRSRSGSPRSAPGSPIGSPGRGSDVESDAEPQKDTKAKGSDDEGSEKGSVVGELIADIFGESDEDEEFEGFDAADVEAHAKKDKAKAAVVSDDEGAVAKSGEVVPALSSDDEDAPKSTFHDGASDFDLMLAKKKEEMGKRRRKRKDVDIVNDNDDLIAAMIQNMKTAAEEDRELNSQRKPAVRKLKLLPKVAAQLRKADMQEAFLDCNILNAMTEWLAPLPDKSLPHLRIREVLLRQLLQFPPINTELLKSSGVGKAVMYLYKHPKEMRENRTLAGKLVNEWSRPIFNLTSNYKSLSREEREHRDYEQLPKKRKLSLEGSQTPRRDIDKALQGEEQTLRPGDPGYIGRARVPQPSKKDYVIRPKWKVEDQPSRGSGKKSLDRFEKHLKEFKDKKTRNKTGQKAVAISIEGRNMNL